MAFLTIERNQNAQIIINDDNKSYKRHLQSLFNFCVSIQMHHKFFQASSLSKHVTQTHKIARNRRTFIVAIAAIHLIIVSGFYPIRTCEWSYIICAFLVRVLTPRVHGSRETLFRRQTLMVLRVNWIQMIRCGNLVI